MIRTILAAVLAIVSATPASAKWREASSDHFVIYSEGSEAELRGFAEKLERFDATMRFVGGIDPWVPSPSNRLTIYVVPSLSSVRKLYGDRDRNAAGFYVGRAGGSIAIVPRNAGARGDFDLDPETVLLHEYAHHFMFQNFVSPVPAWFTEGYAEFFSTARFEKDGAIGIGLPALHRAYGLVNFDALSMAEMMNYRSGVKLNSMERENLYGRGWLLTHFLTFETARKGQLDKYLKVMSEGKQGVEAGTEAFGDLKKLDGELDRYLRRRSMSYMRVAPEKIASGKVTVRELRAGEGAVMMSRIRSDRGVNLEEAKALLPDIRRQAAPYPDDAVVQAALAEAEYDARNYKEAEEAADRAMAADPRSSEALLYKGRIRMALAEGSEDKAAWKDVRHWFVQANKLEPEDPEPLLLYYRTFGEQGIEPTKTAVDGLIYAADLAREEPGLRLMAAREYLRAGKTKEGRLLLSTIAYNPHGGRMAEFATSILTTLDSAGSEGALAAWSKPSRDDEDEEEE